MRALVLISLALWLGGCAYVGDPLPPALKIPTPVSDLAVRQVGGELIVSFTVPEKTIEGLKLNTLVGVDLRVGPNPPAFTAEAWASGAQTVAVPPLAPGKMETRIDARPWTGREVVVGLRLAGARNRVSPWSNFVSLNVVEPLEKPGQLRAEATANGVVIEWSRLSAGPNVRWKIYRQSKGEAEPVEMATVREPRFTDIGAAYDVEHRYTVLATEGTAVSMISDEVAITPEDKFAPAPPQGLSALAGPNSAQLSWERNQEPDLALYRIYRAGQNTPFVRIAESSTAANYRDNTVMAGQKYRYAISAVDRKGNESPQSEPVEILIP